MKRHRPVDDRRVAVFSHLIVHCGVGKAEHDRFIADERLIVAFAISDRVDVSVRQLVPDRAEVPLFIRALFYQLYPHIRQAHAESVIESDTAVGDRIAHSGHTAHILRDGEAVRIKTVYQFIRELKVRQRLNVGIHRKIHREI